MNSINDLFRPFCKCRSDRSGICNDTGTFIAMLSLPSGHPSPIHLHSARNKAMSTRTVHKWIACTATMLAMGVLSSTSALAQAARPWGFAPLPWTTRGYFSPAPNCANGSCGVAPKNSTCPNGTCSPRTGTPSSPYGVSRPTYQVTPSRPNSRNLPSANRESPFYEYRDAPSRSSTPPVRRPALSNRNLESPFYP